MPCGTRDVIENRDSSGYFGMFERKGILLKNKEVICCGSPGGPKNEGISGDVYENKGRGKWGLGESEDVYENKQVIAINTRCLRKKGSYGRFGPRIRGREFEIGHLPAQAGSKLENRNSRLGTGNWKREMGSWKIGTRGSKLAFFLHTTFEFLCWGRDKG